MALTVFWDPDFVVKTLQPVLRDNASLTSPQTVATTAHITIVPQAGAITLQLFPDYAQTTCKVKLEFGTGAGPTFTGDYILVDLNAASEHSFPLQNITAVKITNNESGNRNINYIIYITV